MSINSRTRNSQVYNIINIAMSATRKSIIIILQYPDTSGVHKQSHPQLASLYIIHIAISGQFQIGTPINFYYRHLIYSPADNCKADTRCSPILILPPNQVVLAALRYYILFSMMWSRMWCVYYLLVRTNYYATATSSRLVVMNL